MGGLRRAQSGGKCFFFAGGGTGGHIYPAVAIAEKIIKTEPTAKIHFFISSRDIDTRVLKPTGFETTVLPAGPFSARPDKLIGFCRSFFASFRTAGKIIAEAKNATVVGVGGFVAAPVCLAGRKLKVPVKLVNVDIVPGRANKLTACFADEIFVQFEDTRQYFAKAGAEVNVVGCPLRSGFENPDPHKAIEQLGLDENKKTLLITGASSGSDNINRTVCCLLEKLSRFADSWQIVHLTGHSGFQMVKEQYTAAAIGHKVLSYCDDMPNLLAAADLVVGRSGAVSVAEYAAAAVPSICMPYPYHRDRHQYLNAGKLVEAGVGVIVDDVPNAADRKQWLAEQLEALMKDDQRRKQMSQACSRIANKDAASRIAEKLLEDKKT